MDLESLAIELNDICQYNTVFITTQEPIVNFTKVTANNIIVFGVNKKISINIGNEIYLNSIYNILAKFFDEKTLVIGWDIKDFFTFFKYHIKSTNIFVKKFVDLKLMEKYLEISLDIPNSLQEAVQRFSKLKTNEKLISIHNKIHKPLASKVIPSIESQGLFNNEIRKKVYPKYEIEGQVNGRLRCFQAFPNCINPHTLTTEEKEKIKLSNKEEAFVCFDFQGMEVVVLQYLSEDKKLKEIIEEKEDYYINIWKKISESTVVDKAYRKFVKDSFLPVMYGLSSESLSEKIGISKELSKKYISSIKSKFKESCAYIDEYQKNHLDKAEDFFGRIRFFQEKFWAIRNFCIQSPSSIICLEKLIGLYDIIGDKIIFSIHDGYLLRFNLDADKEDILKCKKYLESPSELAPNLKLRVSCQIGKNLNKMKSI